MPNLPGGMDSSGNIDLNDPNSMFMLSDDMMAIFNNGSVDMAALFQPDADFGSHGTGGGFESPGLQQSKSIMAFASPSS